jgi:hypothetical protein
LASAAAGGILQLAVVHNRVGWLNSYREVADL